MTLDELRLKIRKVVEEAGGPWPDEMVARCILRDAAAEAFGRLCAKWESVIAQAVATGIPIEDLAWKTEAPMPGRPMPWRLERKDGTVIASGEDGS
jgi:hypothetical protein